MIRDKEGRVTEMSTEEIICLLKRLKTEHRDSEMIRFALDHVIQYHFKVELYQEQEKN